MRKKLSMLAVLVMFCLTAPLLLSGCKNQAEESYRKEVKNYIDLIETQIVHIEQHHDNMRKMIAQMRVQLDAMQAELDQEAPRIKAASSAVKGLREVNAQARESALEYTAKNPSWNFLYLMLFLLLLWVFYRLKVKASAKSSQS